MPAWITWMALAIGALLLSFVLLSAIGAWRWHARTRELIGRLEAARQAATPSRFEARRDLDGLPAPVQRFFRAALAEGSPMVVAVNLEHRGRFNLAAEGPDRWIPFSSVQRVTTRRPGFVWNACMTMAPGLTVRVHDAYIAGEGILHPALLGLVSLTGMRGSSPEPGGVAQGEFMRYVAEAAWYPTALLPSQGARWTAIDEHAAQVSLDDGSVNVSLRLRFDPDTALIDTVRAEARGRTLGQTVVLTPWEGRWWDYAQQRGLMLPMSGEVAWLTPEGRRSYWRGKVTALELEFLR